jgi:hypothetical protein
MKRIIFLLMCFGLIGCWNRLNAQNVEENVRMLNDSIVLYEKKSTDIIVDMNSKQKNRNYKLKIPKIVDFNIKSLSKEDEVFLWIKVVTVRKACKGFELIPDSLKNNMVVRLEQYNVLPQDSIP